MNKPHWPLLFEEFFIYSVMSRNTGYSVLSNICLFIFDKENYKLLSGNI